MALVEALCAAGSLAQRVSEEILRKRRERESQELEMIIPTQHNGGLDSRQEGIISLAEHPGHPIRSAFYLAAIAICDDARGGDSTDYT